MFHLGFYYRSVRLGLSALLDRLAAVAGYYSNQYWIDPVMYGLPYRASGHGWVRYWNDAILVDIYTGTVMDVIPDFFW